MDFFFKFQFKQFFFLKVDGDFFSDSRKITE